MPREDLVQLRRGTEAQWVAAEAGNGSIEALAQGEPGIVQDSNGVPLYMVVGDDDTEFGSLPKFYPSTYADSVAQPATRAIGVRVGGSTVVSNQAETSMLSSAITPTANLLAVSDVVRFRAVGSIINNTGSAQNYRWRIKTGSTALLDTGDLSVTANAFARNFSVEGLWRVHPSGGGQYRDGSITMRIGPLTGGTAMLFDMTIGGTTHTENLASPSAIDLTVDMGAADANLSAVCNIFTLERVRQPT